MPSGPAGKRRPGLWRRPARLAGALTAAVLLGVTGRPAPCIAAEADNAPQAHIATDGLRISGIGLAPGRFLQASGPNPGAGIFRDGEVFPAPGVLGIRHRAAGEVEFAAEPRAWPPDAREVRIALGPFPTDRVRWLTTACDGTVFDGETPPGEYDVTGAIPVVLGDAGSHGFAVRPADSLGPVRLLLRKNSRGIALLLCAAPPRLVGGGIVPGVTMPAWVLTVTQGDWRAGVDAMAATLEREYGFVPLKQDRAAWLAGITGVARLGHGARAGDRDRLLALSRIVRPEHTLLYIPDWRTHPYDVLYPDYTPSDDAAKTMRFARELGYRIMPHANFAGISTDHPAYPARRDELLLDPAGGSPIIWDGRIAELNHAFPESRSLLVEALAQAHDLSPFDAVHLDYPAVADAPRRTPAQLSAEDGARLFLRELRERLPDVALGVEWGQGCTSGLTAFTQQSWLTRRSLEIGRSHPVGGALLGRYRHLYAHLATPHPGDPRQARGALYQMLRTLPLGGIPTLYLDERFDPEAGSTPVFLRVMNERPDITNAETVSLPGGWLYGVREAPDAGRLQGWLAYAPDGHAFGLDPDAVYRPAADPRADLPVRLTRYTGTGPVRCFTNRRCAGFAVGTSLPLDLLSVRPAATGILNESARAPLTGYATFRVETGTCGGISRRAAFAHPPSPAAAADREATFGEFELAMPPGSLGRLEGFIGLRDLPDGGRAGDGVTFRLLVNGRPALENHTESRKWTAFSVPVAPGPEGTLRIRLETDAGPRGDAGYDWALWGEPRLRIDDGPRETVTVAVSRRPQAVIIADATGNVRVRAAEDGAGDMRVQAPASIIHAYDIAPFPATGDLTRAAFEQRPEHGGASAPDDPETPLTDGDPVRQLTVAGDLHPAIPAHPLLETPVRTDWLVQLPLAATALEVLAYVPPGAGGEKAFEIRINGLRRTRAVAPLGATDAAIPLRVDLAAEAGKPTLISLVTDPLGSDHYDMAYWLSPRIRTAPEP